VSIWFAMVHLLAYLWPLYQFGQEIITGQIYVDTVDYVTQRCARSSPLRALKYVACCYAIAYVSTLCIIVHLQSGAKLIC
jgi:hypothetical protein